LLIRLLVNVAPAAVQACFPLLPMGAVPPGAEVRAEATGDYRAMLARNAMAA